jgi:predicted nucleic acid-binding protein
VKNTAAVIAVIAGAAEKATLVAARFHRWLKNVYRSIPIRFVDIDLGASLDIALEHRLYAYDAYLIECALMTKAPLLTLDFPLRRVASEAGVTILELE